jgi:hypothetical protein
MPAGAVKDEGGMRARRNGFGDFLKMPVLASVLA